MVNLKAQRLSKQQSPVTLQRMTMFHPRPIAIELLNISFAACKSFKMKHTP